MSELFIPDAVETTIVIQQVLSPHTAQVELQNGRIVFGYYPKRTQHPELAVGQSHHARMVVADFSRAELRGPVASD